MLQRRSVPQHLTLRSRSNNSSNCAIWVVLKSHSIRRTSDRPEAGFSAGGLLSFLKQCFQVVEVKAVGRLAVDVLYGIPSIIAASGGAMLLDQLNIGVISITSNELTLQRPTSSLPSPS